MTVTYRHCIPHQYLSTGLISIGTQSGMYKSMFLKAQKLYIVGA